MHYGPVMIDLQGTELSAEEKTLLQHPRVGGVILFSRNYQNIDALKKLVKDIRKASKTPLLIAVDHEGGRVWRFNEGFAKIPPASHYAKIYERNKRQGLQMALDAGWIMGAELLDCGIDLSFAPVLDLDKGISDIIGDRAFHRDPQMVTELAGAFIKGMNAVGMSATGKHFPGHGSCALDSHIALPVDPRSLAEIEADDLIPFAQLAESLGGIMPAHVTYPAVDSVPAGFSRRWLQEILRKELQFKGAIISDCLSMKGAAIGGDYVVRAQLALDAGCDMVILCQQELPLITWFLDNLSRDVTAESSERLANLAGKFQNSARKAKKPVLETVENV